jgi:hypothetical protein
MLPVNAASMPRGDQPNPATSIEAPARAPRVEQDGQVVPHGRIADSEQIGFGTGLLREASPDKFDKLGGQKATVHALSL